MSSHPNLLKSIRSNFLMHNWQLFLLDGYKYVDEDYFFNLLLLLLLLLLLFFLFLQDEAW